MARATAAVRRWLTQTWEDLKASTDASLLGVLRFFGLLYGPIDRRARIDDAFRKAVRYRLPPHASWRHALGGVTYLLFLVMIVTGVLLAMYYRPSAQEAYPSIRHILSDVTFGWLVRDLHVWSASLLVVVALLHMAQVFFEAAYKPPRETNWLVGLLLLFVVLAFGATGYLLPWDQWAYWTVAELINALGTVPLVGTAIAELLRGDDLVSGATLSRYFALHVIVLPWLALALLGSHFLLVRTHGVAPPKEGVPPERSGVPFFPHHLLRSFLLAVVVLAAAVSLAALFPRPVGAPADPYAPPPDLVTTWIPVDVSLALVRYLGPWGLVGFTLFGVALAFLPLFDRRPERSLRRRPVVATLGLLYFVGFAGAWLAGRQIDTLVPVGAATPSPGTQEERPATPLPEPGPTAPRPAPVPREDRVP